MVNSNFSPQDKKPGDLILSADWNAAMTEIKRLEKAKVNREGADSLKGPLTIQEALNVTGDVKISGNITVNNSVSLKGSAATTGLSVNASGNVGIGTTNPQATLAINGGLHVGGDSNPGDKNLLVDGRIKLESGVIQKGGNNIITGTSDLGLYSQVLGQWIRFVSNNAPIHFFTENGNNGIGSTTRMVISNDGNVGIGTTSPTENLEVSGNIKATNAVFTGTVTATAFIGAFVKGMILIWSGSEANIPNGWALCNGSNGTPDLRGRFVLASGQGTGLSNRTLNQTGGVEKHQLSLSEMPSHNHKITDPGHFHNWTASRQEQGTDDKNYTSEVSKGDAGSGDTLSKNTDLRYTGITIQSEGSNFSHENMPPFYVLAYIMKL